MLPTLHVHYANVQEEEQALNSASDRSGRSAAAAAPAFAVDTTAAAASAAGAATAKTAKVRPCKVHSLRVALAIHHYRLLYCVCRCRQQHHSTVYRHC
jgi:hypothetical protein